MAAIFNVKAMRQRELLTLVTALNERLTKCNEVVTSLAKEERDSKGAIDNTDLIRVWESEEELITDWLAALDPDNA